MWHEARRQEKKIRGMMVDYRKRAERRRDFYEKFKADPTQFLQLHGRPCKIHLDAAVAAAGDAASIMMPWQGHNELLIDRFDARAHMDVIKENLPKLPEEELSYDERYLNYERYRILVQNDYLGVEEEKFLRQIHLEEQFGPIALKKTHDGVIEKEKEKKNKGAAIGYSYEDSTSDLPLPSCLPENKDDSNSDSDDSEFDFDLCLDLSEVDTASAHELNSCGQRFGLVSNDFYSFLTNDVEEQESIRLAKEQEEEKAMYSGRKARRERQAFREKRLKGRVMSPPSYAARQSPVYDKYNKQSKSRSRSVTPEDAGAITYITSFGDEEPPEDGKKAVPQSKKSKDYEKPRLIPVIGSRQSPQSPSVVANPQQPKQLSPDQHRRRPSWDSPRGGKRYSRSRSWTRSRSRGRLSHSRSRSRHRYRRSRSHSRDRRRSRSLSRRRCSSGSRDRRHSRSYSRGRRKSRSASRDGRKSKSRSCSRRHSRSRSYSRRKSESRSRSRVRSMSPRKISAPQPEKVDCAPVVPRYYGRNRKDSSSSLELSSGDETQYSSTSSTARAKESSGRGGSGAGRSDVRPAVKLQQQVRETPQEKLKRRMQALLNRQIKQDKKMEREKAEQAERERQDRAAELRDIAIKIRRRERYLRHLDEDEDDTNSRSSRSPRRSRSRSPVRTRSPRRSRTPRRSKTPRRSRSPQRLHSSPRTRSPRRLRSPRRRRSDEHRWSNSPPKRSLVDY